MRAPNHMPKLRNYLSQINMIDEAFGRIMDAAPDALIIFTADHGMSLGHHGFWGHGGATFPSNLHRAAHSIPLIISQIGKIKAHQTSDAIVSNMDLFSNIIELAGGDTSPTLPSRSLATELEEKDSPKLFNEVYSEQEETSVLRTQDWVMFKRFKGPNAPDLPDALYASKLDSNECFNLVDDPDHQGRLAELSARIDL